jgi:hypothetical protein
MKNAEDQKSYLISFMKLAHEKQAEIDNQKYVYEEFDIMANEQESLNPPLNSSGER